MIEMNVERKKSNDKTSTTEFERTERSGGKGKEQGYEKMISFALFFLFIPLRFLVIFRTIPIYLFCFHAIGSGLHEHMRLARTIHNTCTS